MLEIKKWRGERRSKQTEKLVREGERNNHEVVLTWEAEYVPHKVEQMPVLSAGTGTGVVRHPHSQLPL